MDTRQRPSPFLFMSRILPLPLTLHLPLPLTLYLPLTLTLFLSLTLPHTACSPEVEGLGPPPIDFAAVEASFATPTGHAADGLADDVARQVLGLVRLGDALWQFVTFYPSLTGSKTATGEGTAASALASETSGLEAYGYVRFSCPGRDFMKPDLLFGSGELRVDLGVPLVEEAAGKIDFLGYVLMTFKKCRIEDDVLAGSAHAMIQPGHLVLSLALTDAADGGAISSLAADALLDADRVAFRFDLPAGSFVVERWTKTAKTLLRAADGVLTCTEQAGKLACVPGS